MKTAFEKITLFNRWKYNKYQRNCDWVILGLSIWWSSPESYCYKFSFFGFELKIWLKRELL